jgi:hypothetical protein
MNIAVKNKHIIIVIIYRNTSENSVKYIDISSLFSEIRRSS